MGLSQKDKKRIVEYCEKNKITYKTGWRNFTGNVSLPQALVLEIQTEDQVVALAKFIYQLNIKKNTTNPITYRAIAAGKSSSEKNVRYDRQSYSMTACMAADILLHLSGQQFHTIDMIDQDEHIVNVGVSIPIGELDRRLYTDHQLCLPTSTLIPYVSIGGAVANGAHGTGRNEPSIAGLVHAMRMVRPDGKIVTIDEHHPDFNIIRGSHLGLFGIVLDMTIQCRDAAKLETTFESTNIFKLKKQIASGLFKHDNVSIMYVPTGRTDEAASDCPPNVMIIRWKPVPLDTPERGQCDMLESFTQKVTIQLQEAFQIMDLLKQSPNLVPPFMQYFVSELEVKGEDNVVVSHWYEAAHFKQAFPRDLADASWLFPTDKTGSEIIDALDFTVDKLSAYAKQNKYPCTYAIFLRFFQGTNGGLSASCHGKDQHVCGFDITSARHMPSFDEFIAETHQHFVSKYHAKPHHGKTVLPGTSYKKLYGKQYDDFIVALSSWLAACNLDLTTNPHLNSFFVEHLEIDGSLLLQNKESHHSTIETEPVSLPEIALAVLTELKLADPGFKQNPTAKILKSNLKAVAATGDQIKVSENSLFPTLARLEKENDKGELTTVPKHQNNCCVLL